MDPLSEGIRSIFGLIWTSIPITFIFTLAAILGLFLFNFFQKKFRWKWAGSALAALVAGFTLLFFLIHMSNLYHGFTSTDSTLIPPDVRNDPLFQADQPNIIFLAISALIQSIISGIIFSILILPFAFGGVALFDGLKTRVKGVWPRIILICFLASVVFILLLGAFTWLLVSLVYLAFFGF